MRWFDTSRKLPKACAFARAVVLYATKLRAAALPRLDGQALIAIVREPQFASHLLSKVSYTQSSQVKEDLLNRRAATWRRVTALVALQSMPARTASPILHAMLNDPVDDIRLLAYGMLDKLEKRLTQRVLLERPKLLLRLSDDELYRIDKTLAELYSELIYARLVEGDVYRNALEQAACHAINALRTHRRDAALWRLRGRLAFESRRLEEAEAMFAKAIICGFPRTRILPYLAEIAYLRGDYARVRGYITEMKAIPPPLLGAVVAYWNT
jgi:polysaccharide biosynthesis protein PelE